MPLAASAGYCPKGIFQRYLPVFKSIAFNVPQGGATAGMAAANVGLGGAKTYTSQVGYLSDKTANQVVAYLSQYFAQQGWISPDQAQKVKLSDAP